MAERNDLDFTYSLTDRVVRFSLGELADFSGAKYDGDFSLSLEQAQRRKHDYVAAEIGIEPNRRVLDLGCGRADCSTTSVLSGQMGLASRCLQPRRRHAGATAWTCTFTTHAE